MSRRLAEKTSSFLAKRTPRRGFLAKSALVGSAMAVAPTDFVLKPRTAYAAICSCNGSSCDCGSLCCDGYTEFCCTIYGTNGCPPGSLYGGWWKVDNSSFCGNGARYYMDCHGTCGGCTCGSNGVCSGSCNGTRCGCALGQCRYRKAGCTAFRYGQCNQAIRCVGPIICRVITCTPPWVLEPNCTTSVRVDEATRFHNAPCLQDTGPQPTGQLDQVVPVPGRLRVAGWALDPDTTRPIDVVVYINGVRTLAVTADSYRPDVEAAFPSFGGHHGFDVPIDTTPGVKDVCVYAVNVGGGANPLLGCLRVTVPARSSVTGAIESVVADDGWITVNGYAAGPPDTPVDVTLYVDGQAVATRRADQPRPTVGRRGIGARQGFAFTVPVLAGNRSVCVEAAAGAETEVSLGCQQVQVRGGRPPLGELQGAFATDDGIRVVGWALDPDHAESIAVRVTVDGLEAGTAIADVDRRKLGQAYPGHGPDHGFDVVVPARSGAHRVCVYAIASDGTAEPLLGCANVSIFATTKVGR